MRKRITKFAAIALAAVALLQAPVMKSLAVDYSQFVGCTGWEDTGKGSTYCSSPACADGKNATKYQYIDQKQECWPKGGGVPTDVHRTIARNIGCCK